MRTFGFSVVLFDSEDAAGGVNGTVEINVSPGYSDGGPEVVVVDGGDDEYYLRLPRASIRLSVRGVLRSAAPVGMFPSNERFSCVVRCFSDEHCATGVDAQANSQKKTQQNLDRRANC